jgi:hypothetical protein
METISAGLTSLLVLVTLSSQAQPEHSSPSAHHDAVDERGDNGMGFSHKMTAIIFIS